MMIQGNIAEETWAEAVEWGRITGTPEGEILGALVWRALNASHPIPVQPAAAWMNKSLAARKGGPRLAVAVLNGREWSVLDDRLRAVKDARPMHGPTPRTWYEMPYGHLDTIRTLFADKPDRVRVCLIKENGV